MLYGSGCRKAYLFVHGKCGCKEEAGAFAGIAVPAGYAVLGIDLPGHGERSSVPSPLLPWLAVPELRSAMEYLRGSYTDISVRANSIGAWFSMLAFGNARLSKALFVSPVTDMSSLIDKMMKAQGVSPEKLCTAREIPSPSGDALRYDYYLYAKEHTGDKLEWDTPTSVLYAGKDELVSRAETDAFIARSGAALTVFDNGGHWFHTEEELAFLDRWTRENI